MNKFAIIALLILVSISAFAKDHADKYQVGTLIATESVRDVNVFGSALANASTAFGHNVHTVQVVDGVYAIASPVSTGGSILMAMATNNQAPTDIHIRWFMDDMHPGDKVLFSAECNKHNDCTFYLPKPDKQGKEFRTAGHFYPTVAQTNTMQLCGTGKLSAAVEAQVCNQPAPTPTAVTAPVTPAVSPMAAADAQSAAVIPTMSCTQIQTSMLANSVVVKSMVTNLPLSWTAIQTHCPTEAATALAIAK